MHVDVTDNMNWICSHCKPNGATAEDFTIFIAAGDISASLDAVKEAFRVLKSSFDAV